MGNKKVSKKKEIKVNPNVIIQSLKSLRMKGLEGIPPINCDLNSILRTIKEKRPSTMKELSDLSSVPVSTTKEMVLSLISFNYLKKLVPKDGGGKTFFMLALPEEINEKNVKLTKPKEKRDCNGFHKKPFRMKRG